VSAGDNERMADDNVIQFPVPPRELTQERWDAILAASDLAALELGLPFEPRLVPPA
jgi:hypothetical protein